MRHTHRIDSSDARDFALEEGCLLCGGELAVRVTASGARSYCGTCRWISRPQVRGDDDGLHVFHPAGLVA